MARVEPDIKARAEEIIADLGLNASMVINALYHQIINTRGIPFSLTIPSSFPSVEDMSDEDFKNMLKSALERAERGEGKPIKKVVDEIRNDNKN